MRWIQANLTFKRKVSCSVFISRGSRSLNEMVSEGFFAKRGSCRRVKQRSLANVDLSLAPPTIQAILRHPIANFIWTLFSYLIHPNPRIWLCSSYSSSSVPKKLTNTKIIYECLFMVPDPVQDFYRIYILIFRLVCISSNALGMILVLGMIYLAF